ncbi:hypothetical protein Dsin_016551 [Dipteronia sinensis]|uniref:Uncharacterized protein n=1 Tax=Dipteronia sinensis TaxID=43782 RepID=A0AAE0ADA7_9ROSI|nr:hypothetical protein Dsin_016551 [Dipteronia sinensis]
MVHGARPSSKTNGNSSPKKKEKPKDKKNQDRNDRWQGERRNQDRKYTRKYTNYTPLVRDQSQILSVVQEKVLVQWPRPLPRHARKDTTKYYRFHKDHDHDHDHDTLRCYQIKDQIKTLIKGRYLKDYMLKREGTWHWDKHREKQAQRDNLEMANQNDGSSHGNLIDTIH